MKKSIFIISLATIALAICLTSCKKDPVPEPTSDKVMLPCEIIFNNCNDEDYKFNGVVIKFTYDSKNRIIHSFVNYSNTSVMPYDYLTGDYTYDANGQLTSIAWKAEGGSESRQTLHYTYAENQVTIMREWLRDSLPSSFNYETKYEWQDGKMVKEYVYRNNDWNETKIFSRDEKGNIIKSFDSFEYHSEIISYGNMKGVFSGINKPDWLMWHYLDPALSFQSVNNPLQVEHVTNHGGNYTIGYNYLEYNSNNYPTKINDMEIKYIDAVP
jgi:hypothetical protein